MNAKKAFSINPGTGMIDVLGHSGYTFESAVADIIDNCISANAKNIILHFNPDKSNPFLYILDDGDGMSLEELQEAAIIGFKDINEIRGSNDLGRYSTGLKSATRSFCNNIVISSKQENLPINSIQIDYAHITSSKKWEAFMLDNFSFSNLINRSGTLVYCDHFNEINKFCLGQIFFDTMDKLQLSLSHIFGKYLLKEKIKIFIEIEGTKTIEIEGWNPFSAKENKSTKLVFSKDIDYKNETISLKAYILPPFNNLSKKDQEYVIGNGLVEQQGFYVYRNDRLISEGGWLDLDGFKLDDKCKSARIEVNIPSSLDSEFHINFVKNNLIVPNDIKPAFMEVAKKAKLESHKNYNYLKHPELKRSIKKDEEMVWKLTKSNQGSVLSINMNHPLIKELVDKYGERDFKKLFNLISKSLPISMIQGQTNTTTISYTQNELNDMMETMYQSLVKEGLDMSSIKKKMGSTEPFKEHLEDLVDFFDKKGQI